MSNQNKKSKVETYYCPKCKQEVPGFCTVVSSEDETHWTIECPICGELLDED